MDDKFEFIKDIGSGRYGVVSKYRDRETNKYVATKRICFPHIYEGVPSSVIREISLLKELEHRNIVRLLEVRSSTGGVSLIFEYLDLDLDMCIRHYLQFLKSANLVKRFLHQILCGLAYCHSHKVLHRDLKPMNLLVDLRKNIIKIADFGLARPVEDPLSTKSDEVVTLLYRAPELLLGISNYSFPIDMWAVGCIFAEMVSYKPLFRGNCETKVLQEIFRTMGVPSEETWPGVTSLSSFFSVVQMSPTDKRELADQVKNLEPAGFDLLNKMLCLNPAERITAHDALNHRYFKDARI